MKYLISISVVLLLFTSSCDKKMYNEGIGRQATLFNESGAKIKFVPYYQGNPVSDYIFTFEDHESFFLGNYHSLSEGRIPGFSSPYVTGMDSFRIIYNDTFTITQVKNDSLTARHSISFKHPRHLGNPENFHWWFVEKTRQMYLEFTFTPEDYEYAREFGLKEE